MFDAHVQFGMISPPPVEDRERFLINVDCSEGNR